VAIEPMPDTFTRLSENIRRYDESGRTTAVNCAAYSSTTTLVFRDYGLVDASLNSIADKRTLGASSVPVRALNVLARPCDEIIAELHLPRVDVVKIDAESSELHVLSGMERIIAASQPRIVMEVGDFDLAGVAPSSDLVEWLRGRGYSAYEYVDGRIRPHQIRKRYEYLNLLFVR
jgi:FkbM family methyltransferase